MTWVKFDDQYPISRKVAGLSDAAFRLDVEGICWCMRNLTDGHIRRIQLESFANPSRIPDESSISDSRINRKWKHILKRTIAELVRESRWHEVGHECPMCPQPIDGWVIHDYLQYQPSRATVLQERDGKAERQRRWRDRKSGKFGANNASPNGAVDASRNGRGDAPRNASMSASTDASVTPTQPRPAPKGHGAGLRPALAPDASAAPASPAAEHAEPEDHKPVAARPPDLAELRARIDTAARTMRGDRRPDPPADRPDSLAELRRSTEPEVIE